MLNFVSFFAIEIEEYRIKQAIEQFFFDVMLRIEREERIKYGDRKLFFA